MIVANSFYHNFVHCRTDENIFTNLLLLPDCFYYYPPISETTKKLVRKQNMNKNIAPTHNIFSVFYQGKKEKPKQSFLLNQSRSWRF